MKMFFPLSLALSDQPLELYHWKNKTQQYIWPKLVQVSNMVRDVISIKGSEYSLNMIAFKCLLAATSFCYPHVHQDNPPNSNQILKGLALKPTITTQQLRFSCWSNGLIQIYPALAGGNPPTDQSPCLPVPDWYSTSCRDFNVIKTSTHCLPFSIIRPTPPPLQGQCSKYCIICGIN